MHLVAWRVDLRGGVSRYRHHGSSLARVCERLQTGCLTQHHHPDKNPDTEGAGPRLVRINEAYAVLSNAAKRLSYDRGLALIECHDERRGLGAARDTNREPSDGSFQTSRPFGFRKL